MSHGWLAGLAYTVAALWMGLLAGSLAFSTGGDTHRLACAAGVVAAGCDLALNCWARMEDMAGICERAPAMSAESAARLERVLAVTRLDGASGDQAELFARRDALLGLVAAA